MIRIPDFLAAVRSEVSPHLDLLAAIEAKAGTDLEGAEHELAAWIASLIRSGNPDVHRELAAIREQLDRIEQQQETIMTSQDDINAATTELTSAVTDVQGQVGQLGTDFTAIQAEIANLQSSGVDTSALNAAVAQAQSTLSGLDPAVQQISSLAPPPAAPPAS